MASYKDVLNILKTLVTNCYNHKVCANNLTKWRTTGGWLEVAICQRNDMCVTRSIRNCSWIAPCEPLALQIAAHTVLPSLLRHSHTQRIDSPILFNSRSLKDHLRCFSFITERGQVHKREPNAGLCDCLLFIKDLLKGFRLMWVHVANDCEKLWLITFDILEEVLTNVPFADMSIFGSFLVTQKWVVLSEVNRRPRSYLYSIVDKVHTLKTSWALRYVARSNGRR